MNKQIYDLIMAILGSDISKDSKDEIVRFYTLPRNTPVRSMVETPNRLEVQNEIGTVKRPSIKELDRIRHPEQYEGVDAVRDTLDSHIKINKDNERKES